MGLGLDDFGYVAGAHGLAGEDGRDVETLWVDAFGDPTALGGVVGEEAGFEEDLVILEGGERFAFEGEGWRGACEDWEAGRGVAENVLFCMGGKRHRGRAWSRDVVPGLSGIE